MFARASAAHRNSTQTHRLRPLVTTSHRQKKRADGPRRPGAPRPARDLGRREPVVAARGIEEGCERSTRGGRGALVRDDERARFPAPLAARVLRFPPQQRRDRSKQRPVQHSVVPATRAGLGRIVHVAAAAIRSSRPTRRTSLAAPSSSGAGRGGAPRGYSDGRVDGGAASRQLPARRTSLAAPSSRGRVAAPPRGATWIFRGRVDGGAATRLHGTSTSRPRRRRCPLSIHTRATRTSCRRRARGPALETPLGRLRASRASAARRVSRTSRRSPAGFRLETAGRRAALWRRRGRRPAPRRRRTVGPRPRRARRSYDRVAVVRPRPCYPRTPRLPANGRTRATRARASGGRRSRRRRPPRPRARGFRRLAPAGALEIFL